MFDYLQQFNNLPKDLRDKVSSPLAMSALAELEKKYQVDLAMAVMKVMTKSLAVKNLPAYFISDLSLSQLDAENLTKELTAKIFVAATAYLGLEKEAKVLDLDADINLIISEAGLVLPSSDLVNRFKNILSTYLKGIRSKMAARDAFTKPSEIGGLNLTPPEVDRVFKVCEQKTFKSLEVSLASASKIIAPQSRLDKIIASADGANMGAEYNLKQAIASGQIKKPDTLPVRPVQLDTSHELPIPEKELNLPLTPKTPPIVPPVVPIAPIAPSIVKPATLQPIGQRIVQSFKPVSQIVPPITPAAPKPVDLGPVAPLKTVAASRPVFSPSISKQAMHDIRPIPKVMGPLEELQFLDLVNFRRLGKTPAEITAKIFSKIKLLEADGYDKMVSGVRAWRQSPVNRLYIKMVQEAIGKGLTIKEYALVAQKENKDYLNLEEIEGILTMNSKLVF